MGIDKNGERFQQNFAGYSISAFDGILSDPELLTLCVLLQHEWRESPLSPNVMVRSLIYRSLHPDKSIRHVVEACIANGWLKKANTVSASAWCQARSRLPEALFSALVKQIAEKANARFGATRRV